TRLNGQGNLDPHIHFTGYLGGVYYPLLPAIVAREDQGGAGWFELGRPPERFACRAEPSVRRIQPKEGRLLLFPGYFFHNTIPFTATERRISIAFDLMPRE
ncbi:MAG TPA: putative 2OG-Fe(II) oxygenase, partial [Stellaceae bacterium]|nr:putative 2OG-Fe(II) oxygenase [Stellaceae bacterium]